MSVNISTLFQGALNVWRVQMRKVRAMPIMITGSIFSRSNLTNLFFSPWKTLHVLIDQNQVAFKSVKSGTCFSPMWRRLGRWWQRWGRCRILYSCMWTIFIKDSKVSWIFDWRILASLQVALVWDDMLRTVPLPDIKVNTNFRPLPKICVDISLGNCLIICVKLYHHKSQ